MDPVQEATQRIAESLESLEALAIQCLDIIAVERAALGLDTPVQV